VKKKKACTEGFITQWPMGSSSDQNSEICTVPLKTSWISTRNCLEGFCKAAMKTTDDNIAFSE